MQPDLSSRSLLGTILSSSSYTPPLSFLLTPAVTPTSIGAVCRLGADEIPAHANYCCRCCCCCSYGGYELGSATNMTDCTCTCFSGITASDEGEDGANASCKLHPCNVMLNCTPSIASLRCTYS